MYTYCITPFRKGVRDTPLVSLTLKFNNLHPFLRYSPTHSVTLNQKVYNSMIIKLKKPKNEELLVKFAQYLPNICQLLRKLYAPGRNTIPLKRLGQYFLTENDHHSPPNLLIPPAINKLRTTGVFVAVGSPPDKYAGDTASKVTLHPGKTKNAEFSNDH